METLNSPINPAPEKQNLNVFIKKNGDEIILLDYLYILWRRKILILAVFTAVTATTVIINLFLPKTFEAESFLEYGKVKGQPLVSVADTASIFSTETILKQLSAATNRKVSPKSFKIELAGTDKTKSKYVKVAGRGETPEAAVGMTQAVVNLIIERHKKLFEQALKNFDLEVKALKHNKEKTEAEIVAGKKELASLDGDIKFYVAEINKRSNATSDGQGRIVEAYINLLAGVKKDKEKIILRLNDLNLEFKNYEIQFQQKEVEKNYETKLTKVELEPLLPTEKIAPKRRQNVMISVILSLFSGIFIAFAVEYIQENKKRRQQNSQNSSSPSLIAQG